MHIKRKTKNCDENEFYISICVALAFFLAGKRPYWGTNTQSLSGDEELLFIVNVVLVYYYYVVKQLTLGYNDSNV